MLKRMLMYVSIESFAGDEEFTTPRNDADTTIPVEDVTGSLSQIRSMFMFSDHKASEYMHSPI